MVVLNRIEYYSVVYFERITTFKSLGWDSHMLHVKMEGDGLVHFIVNDVSVYVYR